MYEIIETRIKKRKEALRNEVETFRAGLVLPLTELVRKATSGYRVFQYPDRTRPTLIYFTVGESVPDAFKRVCEVMVSVHKLQGFVLDTEDGLRHAAAVFMEMLKGIGYDFRIIHLLDARELVQHAIEMHEIEGGRVVGIAIDELEATSNDNSSNAAHTAGNSSDADGPDEGNAGGEAPVLPVE
jgi:hypothetical protein